MLTPDYTPIPYDTLTYQECVEWLRKIENRLARIPAASPQRAVERDCAEHIHRRIEELGM